MLVKQPNCDPTKPLAEKYCLVPNYIELNKSIASSAFRKDLGFKSGNLPLEAKRSFLSFKQALITRPCLAPVNFEIDEIETTQE